MSPHRLQRCSSPHAVRTKRPTADNLSMDDPSIDDAIETAARHAREAAEEMSETPVSSPEIVAEARIVDRRVEDLDLLAQDAVPEADSET